MRSVATIREWLVRLAATFRPRRDDSDLEAELRSHMEFAAEADRDARAARLRAGGIAQAMASVRDQRGVPWLADIGRDVRYSLRTLRKTPAFTLGAAVTVALTVGATTAIFSVVYGVLLRQLPFDDIEQVYWIWSDQPGRDRTPFNVPDFLDYRDSARGLSGFAGFHSYSANLSDEAAAERVQGIRATGNLFGVMGARPQLGRVLQPADEQAGREHVVVLTEPFWRRRFAGDQAIVGRAIRLNSEDYTVVGVLAPGFVTPVPNVEFAVPFSADRDPRRGARNSLNFIIGVGRLAGGVSATQAAGELGAIARQLQERFPVENARKRGVRMIAAIDGIVGPFRTALLTLFAAVAAVLLIACANLANLMLTRAAGRRKDLAVQMALGSSRARVVRQVLIEALLVGVSGGAAGVLLARWGVVALVALAPTQLPRSGEIRVDVAVLLFSLAVALLTSVLFGVIPALTSARVDVRDTLQASSRGTTSGSRRIRGALVSSEVALAVVLLVVMAMLAKSFANVQAVAPGFDAAGVLSARLTLPAKRFNNRDAIVTFQRALDARLSSLPGVTRTGAITLLPLSGLLSRVPFTVEGRAIERERVPLAQFRTVSAGYFEAARIPVRRGRTFSESDAGTTRAVAVVNEELARHWLDGLEPIGARLLVDDNDGAPRPVEIVGVVGNVRQATLDGEPTWDLYLTYPQIHADNTGAAAANMFWLVRTSADPATLAAGLTREVRRLDPEIAASQIWPMDRYLSEAMAPRRFSLSLMAAFAVAALALALTGIYAVVAYSVSQRAREIGIRVALGAGRAGIVRLVMGHGLRYVTIGLILGIAIAIGATRLMSTMLFGLAATDAATFAQVAAGVAVVSLLACAAPTARAGKLVSGVLSAE
jgi:putative ABC transport system permease protein